MLVELTIRDLALIEAAELTFGPGLNVITGETGAGKSLLVGALDLILGARPRAGAGGMVRAGAKQAVIEARFELDPDGERGRAVHAWLATHLEDFADAFADSGELILGRSLTAAGRTRARVDQRPVPVKALRGLAGVLVELHGQNDHQRLCRSDEQRALLDAFGDHGAALAAYADARALALDAAADLDAFHARRADRRDRIDLARFQLGELEAARLDATGGGELAPLADERELLRHGEALATELGGACGELSEGEVTLLDRLRTVQRLVDAWRGRVAGLDEPAAALHEATLHVEEAAAVLVSFVDGVEVDPARLDEVEERMAELERLCERFDRDEAGLVALADELTDELAELEREEGGLEALEDRAAATLADLEAAAADLTAARERAAAPLAKQVRAALKGLGLDKARFEARLDPIDGDAPVGDGDAEDGLDATSAAGSRDQIDSATARRATSRGDGDEGPEAADPLDPADPTDHRPAEARARAHRARLARLGPHGAEAVVFHLAANPGEPFAPLADVASGGEVARIMLALRGVLSACESGRTLVFDEVDAGVGGRLGPKLAARLRSLGAAHQVLCVTHLPSLAAAAHLHLKVAKGQRGRRTVTVVDELTGDARLRELADMIAGGADEATARAEAARLLEAQA